MNQVFYLEPDEEITKVIDRIRKAEQDGVILVVPRGAAISQSIINLKLLKRSASEMKKAIGIVSLDKVTNNLSEQLKMPVFTKVSQAETADLSAKILEEVKEPEGTPFEVHTYKKYDLSQLNKEEQGTSNEEQVDEEEETAPTIDDNVGVPTESVGKDLPETVEEETEGQSDEEQVEGRNQEIVDTDEEPIEDEPAPTIDDNVGVPTESVGKINRREEKEEPPMMHSNKPKKHIRTEGSRRWLVGVAAGIVLVILVVSYLFIPYTEASLILKTTDIDKGADVIVDKNATDIDVAAFTLPGTFVDVTKDVSKDFDATGQKDAGAKATGTITISNSTLKNVPVSPNTKVTAADGKIFYTGAGVMAPAGTVDANNCTSNSNGTVSCAVIPSTVDAAVTASTNGDDYNLAAATSFTVGTLKATNKVALAGGVTKNILYITDTDLANAQVAVQTEALDQGKTELTDKANQAGLKVLEKYFTTEIISITPSGKSGDQVDKFSVQASIKVLTLGFDEADLKKLMLDSAASQIDSNQMLINPESYNINYEISDFDNNNGLIKMKATVQGKVGIKISADTVKNNLKNKSNSGAVAYLSQIDGVDSIKFKSWPPFLNRTPILKNRIKVTFDYQK